MLGLELIHYKEIWWRKRSSLYSSQVGTCHLLPYVSLNMILVRWIHSLHWLLSCVKWIRLQIVVGFIRLQHSNILYIEWEICFQGGMFQVLQVIDFLLLLLLLWVQFLNVKSPLKFNWGWVLFIMNILRLFHEIPAIFYQHIHPITQTNQLWLMKMDRNHLQVVWFEDKLYTY